MRVAGVTLFPLKGGRGVPLPAAEVEPRGLAGDRRWVLADPGGRFVSQREMPALARLAAVPTARGLRLVWEGDALEVEIPPADAPRSPLTVWKSTLDLPDVPAARPWLTRVFGRELRLFHQVDDAVRPVAAWGRPGDEVSLADAFPILLATTGSLAAVQAVAGLPIPMERFRPNLVLDCPEAWAEDGWERLRIGGVELDLVKPCDRCIVTTVDQGSGTVAGEEPLATLRRIRMSGDARVPGLLFGWNAVPRRLGRIETGAAVEVLTRRAPWPIRRRA